MKNSRYDNQANLYHVTAECKSLHPPRQNVGETLCACFNILFGYQISMCMSNVHVQLVCKFYKHILNIL